MRQKAGDIAIMPVTTNKTRNELAVYFNDILNNCSLHCKQSTQRSWMVTTEWQRYEVHTLRR